MLKRLLVILTFLMTNIIMAAPVATYTTETAFNLQTSQNENEINLNFSVKPNHYLYKDKLKIKPHNIEVTAVDLPPSQIHSDEFLGQTEVYTNHTKITLKLGAYKPNSSLKITFQGCTDGFCYPPFDKEIKVNEFSYVKADKPNDSKLNITKADDFSSKHAENIIFKKQIETANEKVSISIITIFSFFVFGLGLAFTPCVLPMLPIISSVILGNSVISKKRAFLLSVTYVEGMALSYTLLGLLIVAIGLPLQLVLQSPITLAIISALFIFLAFSMFDLFDLNLPQGITNKLNNLSLSQQGGSFKGVFTIGFITGFIASPCISAPLASMLLYIMQSGDYLKGGFSLFMLAQGIGLPLILVTVLGKQILPKSSAWSGYIKTAFGFLILAVPIFLLSRITSYETELKLWSILALSFIIWVTLSIPYKFKYYKIAIVACVLTAGFSMQGLFYQELHQTELKQVDFKQIKSLKDINKAISRLRENEVMMLDLRASWCSACIEYEHKVFNKNEVVSKLDEFKTYQIDFSLNTEEVKEISESLNIVGLPAILFFNQKGELKDKRINGFLNKNEFLAHLNTIKQ